MLSHSNVAFAPNSQNGDFAAAIRPRIEFIAQATITSAQALKQVARNLFMQ